MTKTSGVSFRGKSFWVYDVIGGIFLWHLVDAAKTHNSSMEISWLDDCIESWQVAAAITELSWFADDEWSKEQLELIIKLSRDAISAIRIHGDFTDVEVNSLELINDLKIFTRGMKVIHAEPIAHFGEAFVSLLLNELPAPPDLTWWFYGTKEEVETIRMTANWDELLG